MEGPLSDPHQCSDGLSHLGSWGPLFSMVELWVPHSLVADCYNRASAIGRAAPMGREQIARRRHMTYLSDDPPDVGWVCRYCSKQDHDHFWMEQPVEDCDCCADHMAEVAASDDADRRIDEALGS